MRGIAFVSSPSCSALCEHQSGISAHRHQILLVWHSQDPCSRHRRYPRVFGFACPPHFTAYRAPVSPPYMLLKPVLRVTRRDRWHSRTLSPGAQTNQSTIRKHMRFERLEPRRVHGAAEPIHPRCLHCHGGCIFNGASSIMKRASREADSPKTLISKATCSPKRDICARAST